MVLAVVSEGDCAIILLLWRHELDLVTELVIDDAVLELNELAGGVNGHLVLLAWLNWLQVHWVALLVVDDTRWDDDRVAVVIGADCHLSNLLL